MSQLFAFRRTLVACVVALCSIVIVASASPADARPRHRSHHAFSQNYFHQHHAISKRTVRRSYSQRRHSARRSRVATRHEMRRVKARKEIRRSASARKDMRRAARASKIQDFRSVHAPLMPQDGVSTQDIAPRVAAAPNNTPTSTTPAVAAASISGSGAALVAQARRYIGGNPTGRSRLWCARFMNMVLQRAGLRTTGSDMARSFASYGQRVSGPRVGAIAVMSRGKRGGHVGIVSGVDARGNPIVVSGNHNRRVAESVYSRGRVYAYVMPN